MVTPPPAAPEFVDECETINDGYTVPEDTEWFTYEVVEDADTMTVVIDAVLVNPDENEFPEGAVTHWEFTFTDEECPLVVTPPPAAPEFIDECETINDGYTVPDDTEWFTYEVV